MSTEEMDIDTARRELSPEEYAAWRAGLYDVQESIRIFENRYNNNHRWPVLALTGNPRAGKTTIAQIFDKLSRKISYRGSISDTILPYMAEYLQVDGKEARLRSKLERDRWYRWFRAFSRNDPARLVKLTLLHSTIVDGIRSKEELDYSKAWGIVDLVIWVSRPGTEEEKAATISEQDSDVTIANDKDLNGLAMKLGRIVKTFNL